MIRGSDGLDYEDLTAKLLGEPAETFRNLEAQWLRRKGHPEERVVKVIAHHDARGDYYDPRIEPLYYPDDPSAPA